jgi:hypothetical protein
MGFTQDEMAAYARVHGLKWNAAKAANFEAGRWTPTLRDVLLVGMTLEWLRMMAHMTAPFTDRTPRDRQITLADLLNGGGGFVALNDEVALPVAQLTAIGRGKGFPLRGDTDPVERSGLAEQRLAKSLGMGVPRLAHLSSRLWGRTFSEERDRRAGAGVSQQKKGRISRELRAELEKALSDGND